MPKADHGGRLFDGQDLRDISRLETLISADVLDAWFDPSPRVVEKLREHLPFLARTSPPVHPDGLIAAISETRGIVRANLCVGGGSSQLIFACLPDFTTRNGRALLLDPTYSEYAHVLGPVLGREIHRHTLHEEHGFRIESRALLEHARRLHPELVVIVNPNNPTGQYWPRAEILEFVRRLPDTFCLVDEAYIDYVAPSESLERDVERFKNLVIIKSMSKAYALSGLRVAYLAASSDIIRYLERRLPPWASGLAAQVAAIEALRDPEYYRDRYRETHALRVETLAMLKASPLRSCSTHASTSIW
jgi:histidinol-phosphate/aromatic aminotransferase/cobyric acid decarboxylase-like protein